MQGRRYRKCFRFMLLCCTVVAAWSVIQGSRRRLRGTDSFGYSSLDGKQDSVFVEGCLDPTWYREQLEYSAQNATFVMLTRNEDIEGVLKSLHSIERHFNQWYQYPYVFLNDAPFTPEFVQLVKTATRAETHFGVLSVAEWEFPPSVREQSIFQESIDDQGDRGIMYGNMESYHKMCRFFAGAFYQHPLVRQYEWYWRLEPDVEFFCDLTYDPFFEMHRRGKKYGFTVLIKELYWTVPNLFRFTRSFIRQNNVEVGNLWRLFVQGYNVFSDDDLLDKLVNYDHEIQPELEKDDKIKQLLVDLKYRKSEELDRDATRLLIERASRKIPVVEDKFDNEEFNLCHFWSNFEIARVDLFSEGLYAKYFEFLEASGGFWTERWGDAPVHSLGLGIVLDVADVHYFRDIGYQHSTLVHCPINKAGSQLPYAENPAYSDILRPRGDVAGKLAGMTWTAEPAEDFGVGCRCECPRQRDIEDTDQCFNLWYDITRDA
ncbi:LADA_0E11320g1_1 [Lachancea dasiensis]|uniref:LADA_0E11320g1_1 n=1 Tax=Lachancea dasiensis TaxID=1072105 RepID=A0A1G4JEL3_9SACH|nr:LADA_0E11320g1_1 [Lachancea dasiensis]